MTVLPLSLVEDIRKLYQYIDQCSRKLGFENWGIADLQDFDVTPFKQWLDQGFQGEMTWLADNMELRSQPRSLHPGSRRALCVTMRYQDRGREAYEANAFSAAIIDTELPGKATSDSENYRLRTKTRELNRLKRQDAAYIAMYARGRDYHKVMRKRLKQLSKEINDYLCKKPLLLQALTNFDSDSDAALNHPPLSHLDARPFVDSAPVLERPLAERAGLGWIGKHSLLLSEDHGSYVLLGELFTPLLLPASQAKIQNQCGDCNACNAICPTDAFVAPYVLDAKKCLAYLSIEHRGPIPVEYRKAMGNRVFGCDDCQLACPYNRPVDHKSDSAFESFRPRHKFTNPELLTLLTWTEEEFLTYTEGSPIRRTGYACWLRNLCVGIGNITGGEALVGAAINDLEHLLKEVLKHYTHDSRFTEANVSEHARWAIAQLQATLASASYSKRKLGPGHMIAKSS